MRLIVRDAQGMSGKKVEIYSLPYSRIEMWTRAGHIKVKLGKGIDVRKLDNLIAHMVLHAR